MLASQPINLVICDNDGCLNDIEVLRNRLWPIAAEMHGVAGLTPQQFQVTLGKRSDGVIEEVRKLVAPNLPYEDGLAFAKIVKATRDRLVNEHLDREGVPEREGRAEFLNGIKDSGLPLALNTSTKGPDAFRLIDGLGMRDFFPVIVTGEQVTKGKPDGESYEKARCLAEEYFRTSFPRESCLGVEDSNDGGEAVLNANMQLLIVRGLQEPAPRIKSSAAGIVDNLRAALHWVLGRQE